MSTKMPFEMTDENEVVPEAITLSEDVTVAEEALPAENAPELVQNAPEEDSEAMDIEDDDEEPKEPQENLENPEKPDEISPEAVEKSRVQKEAFMEMFRIAPRVHDVLPDLRVFVGHPDVIDAHRREIQELVDVRIGEEKAKKRAEKALNREKKAAAGKEQGNLADVIRTATGIDLAGILSRAGKGNSSGAGMPIIETINLVPPSAPMATPLAPSLTSSLVPPSFATAPPMSLGTTPVQNVGRGKAGFSTPHPNEVPLELRHTKPDLVAPIPDVLRSAQAPGQVPAIPNALLPLNQQQIQRSTIFVRPALRKTLFLAGARAGKRSERIKEELEKLEKERNRKRDLKDPLGALNRSLPPGVTPYPNNFPEKRGKRRERERGEREFEREKKRAPPRHLPPGLNKNSPLPVKRYHARQLAKETGISLDEAMAEIEEQCAEFGVEETEEKRKADEEYMNHVKKRGDEYFNSRHNYTPADHSKGIPGVDRPPAGLPGRAREERAPRGGPGVDRPPGGGGGQRDQEWGRRRKRGGVKEREKRLRRDDYNRGPPGNKYGRYDDQRNQRGYDDYGSASNSYQQEPTGYENQSYEGYYEGQNQNYEGHYGEGEYDASYDYYQQGAGQESSYYQEDGGQYYNEYYGTTDYNDYSGAGAQAPPTAPAPPKP